MRQYPAIEVRTDATEFLLAIVDDFGPTALEECGPSVRIFFATASARDSAQQTLAAQFDVTSVDVDDEDWARRSQESLGPVTVGRIMVFPRPKPRAPSPGVIAIVIVPSMGFGTGHHVTTRLCLAALQTIDLTGRNMLDVGTGSGVLAIAADRLGAAQAIGIDFDPDAIQSARENLDLNPEAHHVTFETIDLAARALPAADVVTANLTGTLLTRSAGTLLEAVRSGGVLILSGIQSHERDQVREAFVNAEACWERDEDGWVGIAVKKP
jgi:ribosomal protein L11 methyltransferase